MAGLSGSLWGQQDRDDKLKIAQSLERSKSYEQALQLYKQVFEVRPTDRVAILGIVRNLKSMGRYEDLIHFLSAELQAKSVYDSWRIDLGEAYFLNSQRERAFATWDDQLRQASHNPTIYRLVANAMVRHRLYDEAIAVYKQALQNTQNQFYFYLDIANLYQAILDSKNATIHYLNYYKYNPGQNNFIQRQILNLANRADSPEPIIEALIQYLDQNPDNTGISEILAGLYIRIKNYSAAYSAYLSLENSQSAGKYLLTFAKEAATDLQFEFALQALDEILNRYSGEKLKNSILFEKGIVLRDFAFQKASQSLAGSAEENIQRSLNIFLSLAEIEKFDRTDACLSIIGDIYFEYYFDIDRAIQFYNSALKKTTNIRENEQIRLKLGIALLSKNEKEEALQTFASIRQKELRTSALKFNADIQYYSGSFSRAVKEYNRLIEMGSPGDTLTNNALKKILFINKFKADSLQLARFANAELLIFQKKYSEAAKNLLSLIDPENAIGPEAGWLSAKYLARLNKFSESIQVLENVLEYYPENINRDKTIFMLASVYQKNSNPDKAYQYFQQIILNFPSSLYFEDARFQARKLNESILKGELSG